MPKLQSVAKTQASSTTLAFTVAGTTPGSRLIIGFAVDSAGYSSCSGGGTWPAVEQATGQAHLTSGMVSTICDAVVTTITITWTGTVTNAAAVIEEWPMVSHSPVGAKTNSAGGNDAAPAVGPSTPLDAEHVTVALLAHRGTFLSGPSGGFTDDVEAKIGTVAARLAYLEGHTKAAETCGWTLSGVAFWDTAIVQYERPPNPDAVQTGELTDQIASA